MYVSPKGDCFKNKGAALASAEAGPIEEHASGEEEEEEEEEGNDQEEEAAENEAEEGSGAEVEEEEESADEEVGILGEFPMVKLRLEGKVTVPRCFQASRAEKKAKSE